MDKSVALFVLAVVMATVIVGVDFAFLRELFWLRLMVNAAIVLATAVIYWRFLK